MPKPKNTTNPIPENLRADFAAQIAEADRLIACTALQALATGLLARQVKTLLPHGEFGPWLKANLYATTEEGRFNSQSRKLNMWMQLSEAVQQQVKLENFSNLAPLEWLQAAFLAITKSKEASAEWKAWLAAVHTLLHENTQRDLILELRAAGDENWQGHTPAKGQPDQMNFDELFDGWMDIIRPMQVHRNNWVGLEPEHRWIFVEHATPMLKEIVEATEFTRGQREQLLDQLIGINNHLRAQLGTKTA